MSFLQVPKADIIEKEKLKTIILPEKANELQYNKNKKATFKYDTCIITNDPKDRNLWCKAKKKFKFFTIFIKR